MSTEGADLVVYAPLLVLPHEVGLVAVVPLLELEHEACDRAEALSRAGYGRYRGAVPLVTEGGLAHVGTWGWWS